MLGMATGVALQARTTCVFSGMTLVLTATSFQSDAAVSAEQWNVYQRRLTASARRRPSSIPLVTSPDVGFVDLELHAVSVTEVVRIAQLYVGGDFDDGARVIAGAVLVAVGA